MNVVDLINNHQGTAFTFEILPPLKGNSIQRFIRLLISFVSLIRSILISLHIIVNTFISLSQMEVYGR